MIKNWIIAVLMVVCVLEYLVIVKQEEATEAFVQSATHMLNDFEQDFDTVRKQYDANEELLLEEMAMLTDALDELLDQCTTLVEDTL